MTPEQLSKAARKMAERVLNEIHGRGDRELTKLWIPKITSAVESELAAFAESLVPALGGDSGASPAPHLHSTLKEIIGCQQCNPAPVAPLTAEGAAREWLADYYRRTPMEKDGLDQAGKCAAFARHFAATETARADRLKDEAEKWQQLAEKRGARFESAERALAEARKAAEWVRCADRLPAQCETVLFFTNEGITEMGMLRDKEWICERTAPQDETIVYDLYDERVTHWRPLPEPPKSETPKETTNQ